MSERVTCVLWSHLPITRCWRHEFGPSTEVCRRPDIRAVDRPESGSIAARPSRPPIPKPLISIGIQGPSPPKSHGITCTFLKAARIAPGKASLPHRSRTTRLPVQVEARSYDSIDFPDLVLALSTDLDTLRNRKVDLSVKQHIPKSPRPRQSRLGAGSRGGCDRRGRTVR